MDEVNTLAEIKELVKKLEKINCIEIDNTIFIREHCRELDKRGLQFLSTEFYRETKYLNRLTELLIKELS